MSDYSVTTDFSAKDALSTGDPEKLILGSDFDVEFDAIAVAVATKYDSGDLASQAQAEAESANTVLMTPLRVAQWSDYNAGIVGDLQALADPNADRILFWDDGAGAAAFLTVSTGLTLSGTNLTTNDSAIVHDSLSGFVANEHINHTSVTLTAGYGLSGGGDISTNRSFAIDASELDSAFTVADVVEASDGVVISDGGNMEVVLWNKGGVHVETFAVDDEVDDTMYGLFMVHTGTTAHTLTFNSASNAAHTGAVILIGNRDTGNLTLAATGSSTFTSSLEQGGTTNRTVLDGGTVMAVHVGSDEWMLVGDLV